MTRKKEEKVTRAAELIVSADIKEKRRGILHIESSKIIVLHDFLKKVIVYFVLKAYKMRKNIYT